MKIINSYYKVVNNIDNNPIAIDKLIYYNYIKIFIYKNWEYFILS